jgi:hypothetical protein
MTQPQAPLITFTEQEKQAIIETSRYLFAAGLDNSRAALEARDSEEALRYIQIAQIAGILLLGVGQHGS